MTELVTFRGSNRLDTHGEDTSDSSGTGMTGGSSANTEGSWVELVSSTPFRAGTIIIQLTNPATASITDCLADIAVGASGSEQTIITNLGFGGRGLTPYTYILPVIIPEGVRLAARMQGNAGSKTGDIIVTLIASSFDSGQQMARVTTYGANTADSGGVPIEPGGSANTVGSVVEIEDSTENPIRLLYAYIGNINNNSRVDASWLIDIMVGAAGSEVVLIPDLLVQTNLTIDSPLPGVIGPIPVYVPAGSRLGVRAQCSITDATDRLIDIILYGVS